MMLDSMQAAAKGAVRVAVLADKDAPAGTHRKAKAGRAKAKRARRR
jgi:hypothetical protein